MKIKNFACAMMFAFSFSAAFASASSGKVIVNGQEVAKCSAFVKNPFPARSAAFEKANSQTIPFIKRAMVNKGYVIASSEEDANLVIYDTSLMATTHITMIEQSTGVKSEANEWCDPACWFKSVSLKRALTKVPECK